MTDRAFGSPASPAPQRVLVVVIHVRHDRLLPRRAGVHLGSQVLVNRDPAGAREAADEPTPFFSDANLPPLLAPDPLKWPALHGTPFRLGNGTPKCNFSNRTEAKEPKKNDDVNPFPRPRTRTLEITSTIDFRGLSTALKPFGGFPSAFNSTQRISIV